MSKLFGRIEDSDTPGLSGLEELDRKGRISSGMRERNWKWRTSMQEMSPVEDCCCNFCEGGSSIVGSVVAEIWEDYVWHRDGYISCLLYCL